MQIEALVLPVIGERFVQPLEQRAGPLGVRPRRVVADDIVRRGITAEAGRQLGQHLLGEFGRGESGLNGVSSFSRPCSSPCSIDQRTPSTPSNRMPPSAASTIVRPRTVCFCPFRRTVAVSATLGFSSFAAEALVVGDSASSVRFSAAAADIVYAAPRKERAARKSEDSGHLDFILAAGVIRQQIR